MAFEQCTLDLWEEGDEVKNDLLLAGEPTLADYVEFIVFFSGGKDSIACVLHLLDLGVDPSRIEIHHHLVDGKEGSTLMDWPVGVESVAVLDAKAFDGRPIVFGRQFGDQLQLPDGIRRHEADSRTISRLVRDLTRQARELTYGNLVEQHSVIIQKLPKPVRLLAAQLDVRNIRRHLAVEHQLGMVEHVDQGI